MPGAAENSSNNPTFLSHMNVTEWAFTSPSGQWVATGLVAFPKPDSSEQLAFTRVIIFNTQSNIKRVVLERWDELNLGFPYPEPLEWSSNEDFFYFTNKVIPDGCPAFHFLSGLFRTNLGDGTVGELLAANASSWVALSPDQSIVAYAGVGGRGLVFRDLEKGEEKEISIDPGKDYQAGYILWSPDGKFVVLTLAINRCAGNHGESSSILLVDAETLQTRLLLQEDPRLFITWDWSEPGTITLANGSGDGALWQIDVNSGEITQE